MAGKPRIAFVGTDWNQNEYRRANNKPGAISQYRLINPMRHLSQWFEIDYWGSDFSADAEGKDPAAYFQEFFSRYDAVVCKVVDNPHAASSMAALSKHLCVPLIVDIDDNIWELKPDQPGYAYYHKGSQKLGIASAFLSFASAVFCSTEPLAKYVAARMRQVHGLEKRTYVLPNAVEPSDFAFEPAEKRGDRVVIGWQGSTTHHNDLKVALPAIARVMKERPEVHLELLGGVESSRVADLMGGMDESVLDRVSTAGGVPAYDGFPHLLSRQRWDIGIAPLTDDVFNRSKSHIKWMEYAMFGIPCVASRVYPYAEPIHGVPAIEDGKTGILCTESEWHAALDRLAASKEERERIGSAAKEAVTANWNAEAHAFRWKQAIEEVLATDGD